MRIAKGFRTLAAAQHAAGVDASNLSRYENGKAAPDLATLERILDGYGASVMDLARAIEEGGEDSQVDESAERLATASARFLELVDEDALREVLRSVVREEIERTQRSG